MSVIARLKPDVGAGQAQADTDTIFQIWRQPEISRIKGDSPDDRMFRSLRMEVESAKTGYSNLSRSYAQPLKVLMYLVGVVLLVANLIYSRFAEVSNYPSGAAIAVVMLLASLGIVYGIMRRLNPRWEA